MPVLRKQLKTPPVWIPDVLLATLADEAERSRPLETGGMLVGWRVGTEVVVTGVIAAGPRAQQARDSFEADGAWQQQQLEETYRKSGRTVTFLGDWHSHPQGRPRPSLRDRETAALVARSEGTRAPQPLTLILARRAGAWRLRCFVVAGGSLRRTRIRVHSAGQM
jgi:integrative and conjugative element protein (TIGR02256 family)